VTEEYAMDANGPDRRMPDEEPPDFTAWEDPNSLLTDQPIHERMLNVVFQLREPATVAAIAERVDCDPATAREYLKWFADAGMVREHAGRPVRYELNRSYLRWRRVERIRTERTTEEIVTELETALAARADYRERFDATHPDEVSLLGLTDPDDIGDVWETLSDWKTVERRAELLDAARRDDVVGHAARIDA
jgi:predicted ArsR family transcriptional regulator